MMDNGGIGHDLDFPWELSSMSEHETVDLWALMDHCTPWCLHVVTTLRIAEHIAAGKDEIGDLAAAANCDVYALHRVLTHLVGKGVFEESSPGRFTLNEAARGLLDPAVRLGLDLRASAAGWPMPGHFARLRANRLACVP